jgi:hypothetical protein
MAYGKEIRCSQRACLRCIIGHREALLNEVVRECQEVQAASRREEILATPVDFTNLENMVQVRATTEAGMLSM